MPSAHKIISKLRNWSQVAVASFKKEGVSTWIETVLEAVEFPAGVTNLDASLANVDRNNFSHYDGYKERSLIFFEGVFVLVMRTKKKTKTGLTKKKN